MALCAVQPHRSGMAVSIAALNLLCNGNSLYCQTGKSNIVCTPQFASGQVTCPRTETVASTIRVIGRCDGIPHEQSLVYGHMSDYETICELFIRRCLVAAAPLVTHHHRMLIDRHAENWTEMIPSYHLSVMLEPLCWSLIWTGQRAIAWYIAPWAPAWDTRTMVSPAIAHSGHTPPHSAFPRHFKRNRNKLGDVCCVPITCQPPDFFLHHPSLLYHCITCSTLFIHSDRACLACTGRPADTVLCRL